jgi:hypothetical protein
MGIFCYIELSRQAAIRQLVFGLFHTNSRSCSKTSARLDRLSLRYTARRWVLPYRQPHDDGGVCYVESHAPYRHAGSDPTRAAVSRNTSQIALSTVSLCWHRSPLVARDIEPLVRLVTDAFLGHHHLCPRSPFERPPSAGIRGRIGPDFTAIAVARYEYGPTLALATVDQAEPTNVTINRFARKPLKQCNRA